MRVNIYAEELTDLVEVISKEIDGHTYNAVRFYMQLPCTIPDKTIAARNMANTSSEPDSDFTTTKNVRGPFMHRPGDDDSAAVTFWGRKQLRELFEKAIEKLDEFEAKNDRP